MKETTVIIDVLLGPALDNNVNEFVALVSGALNKWAICTSPEVKNITETG